jgi:glycosyltransferase involved in cell wall biosynthesis
LRVALDATPLLGARTGVGQFCHELLGELSRRSDLSVAAFGISWTGRKALAGLLPAAVRAVRLPMAARPLRTVWKRWSWPAIEWWTGAVEVVHGTNFVVPPARKAGRVVTVHDLTVLHFPEMCTPQVLEYPSLIRRALEDGAWVHTPSQFVAHEVVERFGVAPERVRAVPHGVPSADRLAGGNPDHGRRLAGADRYILALGTIEPRKDLPGLVRAFDLVAAEHADAHLVLAGPDGWGGEALVEAVKAAHHGDRVRRLGYVSGHDKAALLAGSQVFAYPSLYEGFGLPPLEAMAAGVPVVATSAGALPEVLGHAAVLVPPRDETALAAALSTLLESDSHRAALVERGHRHSAGFAWADCGDGLTTLYRLAAGSEE